MPVMPMPQDTDALEIPEPTQETQATALAAMTPEADRLPDGEVLNPRVDENQVYNNAVRTHAGLVPHEEALEKLPGYGKGFLARLLSLALAFLAACRQLDLLTDRREASTVDFSRTRLLRMMMLRSWEACALGGHVAMAPIEKILAGIGHMDSAQDTIDLVVLYRANWKALEGKTPLTPALLEEADRLGHAARERLVLVGTLGKTEAEAVRKLVDRRNRLWTLLVRAHDLARRAGILFYGEQQAATKTPSLQSRIGLPPRKKKKVPAPPAA